MWLIKSLFNLFIHQPIYVITWCCTILARAWNSYKWKYISHGIIFTYWCRWRRLTQWLVCQVIVCRTGQWLAFSVHCWNHVIVCQLTRWLAYAGHSWNKIMWRSAALLSSLFQKYWRICVRIAAHIVLYIIIIIYHRPHFPSSPCIYHYQ